MTDLTAARALADELFRAFGPLGSRSLPNRAAATITALAAEVERLTSLAQSYAKRNPWIERAEKAEAALASALEVTDEKVEAHARLLWSWVYRVDPESRPLTWPQFKADVQTMLAALSIPTEGNDHE